MLPIYVSYRPQDAESAAHIIRRCRQVNGQFSVQHDPLRSCPSDTRIEQHVDDLIAACRQILIVIGREWAGLDEYGRYQLSTADIPTRAEVLGALRSGKQTILVLVDDAALPDPAEIPEELQALLNLPIIRLGTETFEQDLSQLFPPATLKERLREWLRRKLRV